MQSRLSPFQHEILEDFFRRQQGFYLTGGGALAGFHLGHRTTEDLDLFVAEDHLEQGAVALREVAVELGTAIESLRTSPTMRRFLLSRRGEGVVIDLIHDPTSSGAAGKLAFGAVRVDPVQEILANKLCALLSRAETRDLVDVRALEQAECRVEDGLELAMKKDSGLTPAQLAWVLSEISIAPDADLPGGGSPAELRDYVSELVTRLARLAVPD